ncbi:MAG: hypothetical protein AAF539_10060 [Planctomycetota bacterium]
MIHYTCDRCRCQINPEHQQRFIVHVEVQRLEDEPVDDDESIDHLAIINDVLESEHLASIQSTANQLIQPESGRVDESGDGSSTDSLHNGLALGEEKSFDLCASCYQQYRRNPLGQTAPLSLHFSSN